MHQCANASEIITECLSDVQAYYLNSLRNVLTQKSKQIRTSSDLQIA